MNNNINPNITEPKAHNKNENKWLVQIGVSRAHVHLTQEHVEALFGEGHQLTILRDLGQAGQFAAKETLNVVGKKGVLQNVRIIGPARTHTQIEISRTETYTLGIDAPIRDSGDVEDSPGAVLIGPKGVLVLEQGCIIARAHIHMLTKTAERLELVEGDKVSILIKGEKIVSYYDVKVRLVNEGTTEFHIDTDEANAAFVETGDMAMINHKEIVIKDNFGNIIEVEADNIKFVQGKEPEDYYSREVIRLLGTVFEYPASVQRKIVARMLNPEAIDPNKYYLFAALEGDKVMGIACFYWMPSVKMAYVEHIGIIPEYRKRGIGSFLFNKIIGFMEKNHPDIEGIFIEVNQEREELENRKQFSLNLGAIPVDTDFYPQGLRLGHEIKLMFKPEKNGSRLTTAIMDSTLQTLTKIL